ncbi:MAG: sirohydrochlorin nickelochelatase [Candidatus Methanospirareceae archaeon]
MFGVKNIDMREEAALVLIGHGSALPYNEQIMHELRRKIEKKGIFKDVRVAFMQINSPGIEETLRSLVEEKIRNIVVLPVFLAKGIHTMKDIPDILKKFHESIEDDNIRIIYGEPIGADDRLVDVLLDRVKEVLNKE